MSSLGSSLVRGAAGTLVLNAAALLLGFLVAVVLSRELGAAGYGAYAFALSWASLLSVPALLGLTSVLVRNMAAYRAHGRWPELRGLFRRANQAVLGASVFLAATAAVVGLVAVAEGSFRQPFLIGLALVPLLALSSVRLSALQALGHVLLARLPETVVMPASFLVLVVVTTHWLGPDFSASWAISVQVLATLGAFALGILLLRARMPREVWRARPAYKTRAWAASAGPLLVVSLLAAVILHSGTIAVGLAASPSEVGVYSVAGRVAIFAGFLSTAAMFPLMPAVAELYAAGEHGRLRTLLPWSARVVLLLSLPVVAAFLVVPTLFLGFFGVAFEGGDTVLRILVVGEVAKLVLGSASLALAMTGRERDVLKGAVAGAAVDLVLLAVLVPPFGAEGAAAALAASGLASNGLMAYLTWKRLQVYTPAVPIPFVKVKASASSAG